jgi:hypothetical protein
MLSFLRDGQTFKSSAIYVQHHPQAAEKVTFSGLLKKGQMQVELCEIPFAGAPEILSIRPDHGRSEAYLAVRRNEEG